MMDLRDVGDSGEDRILMRAGLVSERSERLAEADLLQVLRSGPSMQIALTRTYESPEQCQRLERLVCR
jgi:hypothetical protein